MGDDEISKKFRQKLQGNVNFVKTMIIKKMSGPQYGYLNITFENATADTVEDGTVCDYYSECDPHIVLLINEDPVFMSDIIWDVKHFTFNTTFISKIIHRHSELTIEMWDSDVFTAHDLILRWKITVDDLISTHIS